MKNEIKKQNEFLTFLIFVIKPFVVQHHPFIICPSRVCFGMDLGWGSKVHDTVA